MTMTRDERKYRFSEIISAIHLQDEEEDNPMLPQGTLGLSDGRLKSAIMCQVFKEKEEFQMKLVNALANTALEPLSQENEPSDDDLSALSIAIHTAWGMGAFQPLLSLLGVAGKVSAVYDIDLPEDISLVLRPNGFAKKFGKFDPYMIMDEEQDEQIISLLKGEQDNDDD